MATFAYYLLQSARKDSVSLPLHPNLRQSEIIGSWAYWNYYVDSCFKLFFFFMNTVGTLWALVSLHKILSFESKSTETQHPATRKT